MTRAPGHRRRLARGAARPGVPFLLKDLSASLAGVKMTRGSRFFADTRAPPRTASTSSLKRSGLVIFGAQ